MKKSQYLGSVLAAALLWSVAQLPSSLRGALAQGLVAWSLRYRPRTLHAVRANLAHACGDWPLAQREELQRRYLWHYFRSLLDGARLWSLSARRIESAVQISGGEWIEHYRRRGQGVILHVHHSLALEFVALALARRVPVVGYARATRDPVLNKLIDGARRRAGVELYHRGDSLRKVIGALRRGRVLYYFADEDHGAQRSRFLPLFGRPKATINGLSRLASQSGAAVVQGQSWWDATQQRYRLHISPLRYALPSDDSWRDATRLNAEIEKMVLSQAPQYLWKLEIYKTPPPGERSIYL